MNYAKTKIYSDGSHFIGIPHKLQPWKKRKNQSKETEDKLKERFEKLYTENKDKKFKEKKEIIVTEISKEINNKEKTEEFVNNHFERKRRNNTERKKRLYRKVNLQEWNYFCTFTYDSNKLTEEEFRIKLTNCLRHLANRNKWKYIGVWERSPENNRLHFHSLVYVPTMVGTFEEIKDYSTKNHQMQTAYQNTYFLKRFGRNDFKKICKQELNSTIRYLTKYMEKSGEKIVYSRGLPTYFVSDIIEDDIACTFGVDDRKIFLFDNFTCLNEGEVIGQVCQEVINQMPKSN